MNDWEHARSKRNTLTLCVGANLLLTTFLCVFIPILGSGGSYFRWGPNTELVVISVRIDTFTMYIGLVVFFVAINSVKMIVQHLGWSILGFTTFNPDYLDVYGFNSMTELNVLTNLMQISDSLRWVFEVVVATRQIDLALWGVFGAEFTGFFVVRYMLRKKRFHKLIENDEEMTLIGDENT